MGEMRDSDWSRPNFLRSDWLLVIVATNTTTVHSPQEKNSLLFDLLFYNGDRTQWSSIRSLIIRVIKQIATAKRPKKSDDGSPICLITSMTRPDNYNNICDNKSCFKITYTQYIPVMPIFFASS